MSENSEMLAQFAAITGADEDRAKFYLESSAWKLDVAISRYYENDGAEDDDDVQAIPIPNEEPPSPPQLPPTAAAAAAAVQKRTPAPRSVNSNFATLNSLQASSDDDDEEEGQAFYAGGSEHSGQQVLGPSKKKDVVSGMFKSVQRRGVELVEPKAGGSKVFKGTGYKLGQTTDDTVVIAGASAAAAPPEVSLKLWREGFSVNDGELRSYTDPANAKFLESIRHGEIPQELRQGNSEVYLSMEDRRMESFKQSEEARRPFQGQGHTLGNPAPPVVGATGEEDKPVNEARAKANLNVDSSQPTTNIQIRLTDGTRLVGQFNHTHTVANIRSYIVAARPQYETREFNLLSSYPSRILDDTETISDANLLNSAIMQKLI